MIRGRRRGQWGEWAVSESVIGGLDHSASSGWTWVPSIRRRTPHEPRGDLRSGRLSPALRYGGRGAGIGQYQRVPARRLGLPRSCSAAIGSRNGSRSGRSGSTPGWSRICAPLRRHEALGRRARGGNEALRFFTEERVYQAVTWAFPALGAPAMRWRGPGIPAGWWVQRPPYTATRVRR